MAVSSISIALDRFTTFGDLLKYLRRRAGYTQRELSIAVGYSDTQISRLEHNERMPDLATLTARFLPVLDIEDQQEVAARLLELAAAVRREDAPALGLPPYKGLHFFDEADAGLFFGREALTERLVARFMEQIAADTRCLSIVGASGSGKSSVVRAGLIPALRWRQPSSGWPIFVITPTAHPLETLAPALGGELQLPLAARRLVDDLLQRPERLNLALQEAAATAGAGHALLVVDQFEELFTLCRSEVERQAFVDSLTTAVTAPDATAAAVIVLRADFYAHCARYDRLREMLSQHQEYIGPMTTDELRRAIEEPARCEHWEFEPGLVDLLLHDVGADAASCPEPGALPLLSHALLATWERRRGRTLTLSGYTASGGVRGAIAETAESVFYDQLDQEQRQIARQIFLRLTELGGGDAAADTRRRVSIDELARVPEERESVHAVLSALADARLVTTDANAAEVAHEALIREWPTLRGWLEEDREGLRLHRHLTEAAQDWDVGGRDPGSLYRGARLQQALEWAGAHPRDVNALELAFLDASREEAEREVREREAQRQRELDAALRLAEAERLHAAGQAQANQRLRRRATLLALALCVAGILAVTAGVFGWRVARAERLSNSRELAAAAANNVQVDAERSVLLALQALEQADTLEARNALHQTLPAQHLLRTLPPHVGGAPDVTYSPDGTRIASLGAYGDVTIWDAETGQPLFTLQDEALELGNTLAFSPDGTRLAVAGVTSVVLWDADSGTKLQTLAGQSVGTEIGYNLGVGQISFSPDGARLAVANMDGVSKVWELAAPTAVLELPPVDAPAKAITYSPDGSLLVTGGDEGVVTVWDAGDGSQRHTLTLGGIIHSVAVSPDSRTVAAASEDGGAKIWDATSGAEIVNLPRLAGMYDVVFLADGRLATAGQDGVTRVWDAATGQQLLALASAVSTVIGVAGSPDGAQIATSSYDGSVRLWDAAPDHELLTIPAHAAIVWNVAYSPDGRWLASASVDGTVKLWDAQTGRLLNSLSGGQGEAPGFTSVAISPDGTHLTAGSFDGAVIVWNSETGTVAARFDGHTNLVTGLAFSPDGVRLASSSWDGTATVWDLARETELATFRGNSAPNLAFSPDGRSVFSGGSDGFVYQWDVMTGEETGKFSHEGKEVYGVAVSPDGKTVALGHFDGMISLWDVTSGRELRSFPGHAGLVLRLAFSLDGTRLASAAFDRYAKVWDVAAGEELFSLYGNLSNVYGVAFSPDGSRLATAGADGTVRLYEMEMDALVALARSRVTRELTAEECDRFLHTDTCP